MRVGLVGGYGATTAALAAALAARGEDVTVYTVGHDDDTPATVETDGYRVASMARNVGPVGGDRLAVGDDFTEFLDFAFGFERPEVVHVESWICGVAAHLAADRHGIPTVQSFPDLSAVLSARQSRVVGPPGREPLELLLARGATLVAVACSEDVREVIRMGCPRSRIVALPQGVDVDVFSPTGPETDPADAARADVRIVAAVDELLPHQGLEDLVRAVAKLPHAELVIVGGAAYQHLHHDAEVTRLRDVIVWAGAANRVRFTGALAPEQRAAILRSADVFACASWFEPSSAAVLEAMACGVPVVATEAGAMLDVVAHGVTGVLVPPRHPAKLFAALAAISRGGVLQEGMGSAGRERVRACHAWDRVAEEVANVHQRAVDAPAVARDRHAIAAMIAR